MKTEQLNRGGGRDRGRGGADSEGEGGGGRGGRGAADDFSVLFLFMGRLPHVHSGGWKLSPGIDATDRRSFAAGARRAVGHEKEDGVEGWDPERQEWARIGSWVCMKNCGACCFLGATDAPDDAGVAAQLLDMTGEDGWCKHFDKQTRSCSIHETKPAFCRTSPDSFAELYGVPPEEFETVARSCCCAAIGDVYGADSLELARYKGTAGGDYWPRLSDLTR